MVSLIITTAFILANPSIYGMQPVLLPIVPVARKDAPKHLGTGTYLPNTDISHHVSRSPAMKTRNQTPTSQILNGQNAIVQEPSHELATSVPRRTLPRTAVSEPQTAPSKEVDRIYLRSS